MLPRRLLSLVLMVGLLFATTGGALAQDGGPGSPQVGESVAALAGTAFTYQGELRNGGTPVTATCDFQFSLYDAVSGGAQQGSTQTVAGVTVANGRFTVTLNSAGQFGARAFDGSARWLATSVKCPPDAGYTPLTPRQPLTAAPLAFALPGLRTEQNGTSPNVIGGYISNTVSGGVYGATISGGGAATGPNQVTSEYGTIGGGYNNTVQDTYATIAGGSDNTAIQDHATIAGGGENTADDRYATVGGGRHNFAGTDMATIAGGEDNTAEGPHSTIGGGMANTALGWGAFIGGGGWNGFTIAGNTAAGDASVIGGGMANVVTTTATYGTIGGGITNTVNGLGATVAGGMANTASGDSAFIGGGGWDGSSVDGNTAAGAASTIGGGLGNTASGAQATIGGGSFQTASGSNATIGGGDHNTANGYGVTIGGGYYNIAAGTSAATVSGGAFNNATGVAATVAGGYANTASGLAAFIGGGGFDGADLSGNTAAGMASTIAGGYGNVVTTTASYGAIGGGITNTVSGVAAVVPGGQQNTALGNYSLAAGYGSTAAHNGAFVWTCAGCAFTSSSAADQVVLNALGGFWFGKTGSGPTGAIAGTQVISTSTGAYLSTSGAWTDVSDRNAKMNFAPVSVLDALMALPVQSWQYKVDDADVRHIGPTAQDFYAAFGVGQDDTHLAALDTSGVALAAIQELATVVEAKDAEIAALQAEQAAVNARLAALEQGSSATGPAPLSAALPWLLLAGLVLLNVGGLAGYALAKRGGKRA